VLEAITPDYEGSNWLSSTCGLILMDIALPDISASRSLRRFAQCDLCSIFPIIALTAASAIAYRSRKTYYAWIVDSFIAKPINAKEFFKENQEVLLKCKLIKILAVE
jgi:DNA-binding response OmpR family regulator